MGSLDIECHQNIYVARRAKILAESGAEQR